MRALLSLLLAASPVVAATIAVTDDGSHVLFLTGLRQQGTHQSSFSKVFRLDADGIALIDDPGEVIVPGEAFPENADSIDMSADGSVRATTTRVFASVRCFVRTPGSTIEFTDYCQVSENGRYVLAVDRLDARRPLRVFDLSSRAHQAVPLPYTTTFEPAVGGHWIASEGSFLAGSADGGRLVLVRPSSGKIIDISPIRAQGATVSRDGGTVVYSTMSELSEVNVVNGTRRTLFRAPEEYVLGSSISLATDGTVMFLMGRRGPTFVFQAYVLSNEGSAPRQVTSDAEGVLDAVLAGNGGMLYAWTTSGELISIDLSNGYRSQFIAPHPFQGGPVKYVPGSSYGSILYFWSADGSKMSANASDWKPVVQVFAGSRVAPWRSSGTTASFQVPWETSPGEEMVVRWGDPFWEILLGNAEAIQPVFIPVLRTDFLFYALHEDFKSIVFSLTAPAHAGEIIHVYATGFGPVDPPVATGVVTPGTALSRIVTPCAWSARITGVGDVPVESTFVGLAPALTGIYQADLRYPAGDVTSFTVRCGDATSTFQMY